MNSQPLASVQSCLECRSLEFAFVVPRNLLFCIIERLFEDLFPRGDVTIEAHGNVLRAISSLHGLASQELKQNELDHQDRDYQVLITIQAVK